MSDFLKGLDFKGLPDWFRNRKYDKSGDGHFQTEEISKAFIDDYFELNEVGQRNIFVYSDAQADAKIIDDIHERGWRPTVDPHDAYLPNEFVVSQTGLGLFTFDSPDDDVITRGTYLNYSKMQARYKLISPEAEKSLLAAFMFIFGEPSIPEALSRHGSILLFGDTKKTGSIETYVAAHERAHQTMDKLKQEYPEQFQQAVAEIKANKEIILDYNKHLETLGSGIVSEAISSESQSDNLHFLVYLYGIETGEQANLGAEKWLEKNGLINALFIYRVLFEKTVLPDAGVYYNKSHYIEPQKEHVIDAAVDYWMSRRFSMDEVLWALIITASHVRAEGKAEDEVRERVWRFVERKISAYAYSEGQTQEENVAISTFFSKLFNYFLIDPEKDPESAKLALRIVNSHSLVSIKAAGFITARTDFSPPQPKGENENGRPAYVITTYTNPYERQEIAKKVVSLDSFDHFWSEPQITVTEGTPPFGKDSQQAWEWSKPRSPTGEEVREAMLYLDEWRRKKMTIEIARRGERNNLLWGITETALGSLLSAAGGIQMARDGDMRSLPLGLSIGGLLCAGIGGLTIYFAKKSQRSTDNLETFFHSNDIAPPIISLEEAHRFEPNR